MIHYALRCGSGHEFDGWFKDSTSFDTQAERGLLDCPVCADTSVSRALMAPSVRTRSAARPKHSEAEAAAAPAPAISVAKPQPPAEIATILPPMPDQVRAALQRMRAAVEKHCDYVGGDFADAARDIANGVAPPRPIYGEATPDEEAELRDEGIDFGKIPWVPRANG
jgi:hypothetical protein